MSIKPKPQDGSMKNTNMLGIYCLVTFTKSFEMELLEMIYEKGQRDAV